MAGVTIDSYCDIVNKYIFLDRIDRKIRECYLCYKIQAQLKIKIKL